MASNKRLISLLGMICVLSIGLVGCGSSSGGGSAKGEYTIGVDDVLSGPLASYGQSFLTNARAAVKYVNGHGGVNGHDVKLVTADSAATGQNAASAAQQLISTQHVSAILGFTLSDDCAAVSTLANARKVPIVCTSTSSDLLKPVKPYTFAGNDVELQEIPGTMELVTETLKLPKGSRFAILDSTPLGVQLWAKQLTAKLKAAGYTSVAHETIPVTSVNGATQIAKVVSSKPDVVFAEPVASQYLPLIKALRAAHNNAPVVAAHNGVGYQGVASIKDPNLYSLTPTQYITDASSTQAGTAMYVAGMKSIGQTTLSQLNSTIGAPGFLSTYGVIQSFKSCGYPCDGQKLASAMEKLQLTFPGLVSGNYGWSSQLHSPYTRLFVYAWDPASKAPKPVGSGIDLGKLG